MYSGKALNVSSLKEQTILYYGLQTWPGAALVRGLALWPCMALRCGRARPRVAAVAMGGSCVQP